MDYCSHGRAVANPCVECTCLEQVDELERELTRIRHSLKSEGVQKIASARAYQATQFNDEHDDSMTDGELASLAACYAADRDIFVRSPPEHGGVVWHNLNPFPGEHTFPKLPLSKKIQIAGFSIEEKEAAVTRKRIAYLAKAGALIAAEIDRLSRRIR